MIILKHLKVSAEQKAFEKANSFSGLSTDHAINSYSSTVEFFKFIGWFRKGWFYKQNL